MSVNISHENGFVLRRTALTEKSVSLDDLLHVFEADAPRDMDSELVAFGPSFGSEAAEVFHQRLKEIGLVYVDDYFIVSHDLPDWFVLRAERSLTWGNACWRGSNAGSSFPVFQGRDHVTGLK